MLTTILFLRIVQSRGEAVPSGTQLSFAGVPLTFGGAPLRFSP